MLDMSAGVGEIAATTGLSRQTIYRIRADRAAAEAALTSWAA
jgi:putative DNA-invertase from lambdoid prophage Rac